MATVKILGQAKLPNGLRVRIERHGDANSFYVVYRALKGWRLDATQTHNTSGWVRLYQPTS